MSTENFYNSHSDEFITTTLNLDMSKLYQKFEIFLKIDDKVLDVGCGTGRDLKYFATKYKAEGIEPAEKLYEFAKDYTGCIIHNCELSQYKTKQKFRGIWASASLLHIPYNDLIHSFEKLLGLLDTGGVLYCSFKYGTFEGQKNGRYFTDLTEDRLIKLINETNFLMNEVWISSDIRKGRESEKWLNVILIKIK